MVSLAEVKQNKPDPAEVEKVLSDAINDAETAVKNSNEQVKDHAKQVAHDLKKQDDEAKEAQNVSDIADAVKDAASATLAAEEASQVGDSDIDDEENAKEEKEESDAKALTKGEDEDEDDSESSSDEDSDYDDEFDPDETLLERVRALKEIFPPDQRAALSNGVSATNSAIKSLIHKAGTSLWYLTTTVILLGAPLALSILHETQLTELEKEMNMQQSSSEILTPGSTEADKEKK